MIGEISMGTDEAEDMGLFTVDEIPTKPYDKLRPLFSFPKRRDVKGLKAEFDSLNEDDTLTFLYDNPSYGVNVIQGKTQVSDSGDAPQYFVGGIPLAKKNKVKRVWDPLSTEVKKVIEDTPLYLDSYNPLDDLESLSHGDFVVAEFETDFYGKFSIAGMVTAGELDSMLLVNKWIVRAKDKPGSCLKRVSKVSGAKDHDLPMIGVRSPVDADPSGE